MSFRSHTRTSTIKAFAQNVENEPRHHLTDALRPQTPLSSGTDAPRPNSPASVFSERLAYQGHACWYVKWAIDPVAAFQVLLVPILGSAVYEAGECIGMPLSASNPFAPFLIVQHGVSGTPDDDPRYQKGVLDFLLIAYYIVFWSLCRILIAGRAFPRLGRYCGLKNAAKLERVGEQGYAMCYFIVTGIWGLKIMVQLPIWWYRTDEFWRGYPHWDMIPELKQYYLMQAAHWLHELIIMVLGLERPRKDYKELVVHHIVTLWLIGWSYLTNLTYIGVSVFVSMDVPDVILSLTLLLNYLQMNRIKIPVFFVFFGVWTYFRHWLNLVILHSVWTEFDLIPDIYRRWAPSTGVWLAWWMKYQIFVPIALLQLLNVFWYYLMLRVLYRALTTSQADDVREDDHGEGAGETTKER